MLCAVILVNQEKAFQSSSQASSISFYNPNIDDLPYIYRFIKDETDLDCNSEYYYALYATILSKNCMILRNSDEVHGFLSSFVYLDEDKRNTFFVWQVAVHQSLRGKGYGLDLILALFKKLNDKEKIHQITATVSPDNKASLRMFEKIASRLGAEITTRPFLESKHFSSSHSPEMLVSIGPIH